MFRLKWYFNYVYCEDFCYERDMMMYKLFVQ